jgi:hypothetical protein
MISSKEYKIPQWLYNYWMNGVIDRIALMWVLPIKDMAEKGDVINFKRYPGDLNKEIK